MKCIIMGNGPSLNKVNFRKLKNIDTFSVNKAYMDYEKWNFYPTYYSIIDWWTIRTIKNELIDFMKNDDNIKHFFISSYDVTKGDFDFDNKISYVKSNLGNNINFPKGQWKDKGIPKHIDNLTLIPSVVPFTVQLAVSMGYTEIGLVGVDVRYVRRNDVEQFEEDGEKKVKFTSNNDPNHYRSDYHGDGHLTGPQHLTGVEGNDLTPYVLINEYCKSVGVKIYSCTKNSRANSVYEYKDYVEFINS